MTVNIGSVQDLSKDITDSIEVIKLSSNNNKTRTPKKSSFFAFKKKSSNDNSERSTQTPKKSFTSKMRKFVSNGNQNNSNAPVQSRKKKKSDSSHSDSTRTSSAVSRSSSEPALNQPTEAFVKEAPSMTSLAGQKPKKKRPMFRKKVRNSVLPSNSSSNSSSSSNSAKNGGPHAPKDPVFAVDMRVQNTRLVTPRQRQEIYALNRVMTRLENEKFKRFCTEKGFKGDQDKDVVEYDIFM